MAKREKGSAMHGESGYERIEHDAYFTPTWVTELLLAREHVALMRHTTNGTFTIWEPAAGNGAMVQPMRKVGFEVFASDIADHGFPLDVQVDFITRYPHDTREQTAIDVASATCPVIITNPPYEQAEEFVVAALARTKKRQGMVCMLLRNEWDCAKSRRYLFNLPFAKKVVLQRRPRWSAQNKASPRHNFAWYIWDWTHRGHARIEYAS
jgi:hypothetical protein